MNYFPLLIEYHFGTRDVILRPEDIPINIQFKVIKTGFVDSGRGRDPVASAGKVKYSHDEDYFGPYGNGVPFGE